MSGKTIKKISTMLLISVLLIAFGSTQVIAASFTDITPSRYDWVRPYIEKMNLAGVVKGMTDTSYGPDDSVTREQLITMLIRLMGWESQASGKKLPLNFPKAESVMPWAREYIALAIEKDIVTGKDFENFRPADAAKRFEVAVFAVKAIGLGQEAEDRKSISVSLGFTDGYMIEPEARPYVDIAVEKNIMKGFPDNSFKPNDNFTRAQMATVLHNLSKLIKAHNITSGVVQDVDSVLLPSIEIRLSDNSLKTYNVDLNSTLIYREDADGNLSKIQLKDINRGEFANIIATSGSRAQYIDITLDAASPGTDDVVQGTIEELNLIRSVLTIKADDGKEKAYNIKNQTRVYIDGKVASVYELTKGQSVELRIQDSDIERIDVKGIDKVVKGIIRAVNIYTDTLTIEDQERERDESYPITTGVKIYKDGKLCEFYQLNIGDVVTATVSGSKIERIEAESAIRKITGTLVDITLAAKNPIITIKDDDGRIADYGLDKDVTIRKNNKRADVKDLKKGDDVTLSLRYNVAEEIIAKSVKQDISGTVKTIKFADTISVTIMDDKNKEHVIMITRDTKITKNRKRIEATDIRFGNYLDMEIENDEAISIDVTVQEAKEVIVGKVVNINDKFQVIAVDVENDDGTKKERQIHYTNNTLILRDGNDIRIKRIDEGNTVVIIGQYEDGVFVAETIHDITVFE